MIGATAIFRRTDAPLFDPVMASWWLQDSIRRRADLRSHHLDDGARRQRFPSEGQFMIISDASNPV